jgi:hypothetical protein
VLRIRDIPHPRFFLFLALLFCSIAGAFAYMKPEEAVIFGFNIAALGFIVASIPLFLQDKPEDLRRRGAGTRSQPRQACQYQSLLKTHAAEVYTHCVSAHGSLVAVVVSLTPAAPEHLQTTTAQACDPPKCLSAGRTAVASKSERFRTQTLVASCLTLMRLF